jgi:Protein of unknown function (DUF402)
VWEAGQLVVRREVLNDGRCWTEFPVRVVHDSPELLATEIFAGTPFTFPAGEWPTPDGRHPWAGRTHWEGHGTLTLQRPGDAYAVWVFWEGPNRDFACWYVNFQEPFRRWDRGYDTQDLELDLVIHPGGRIEVKDDDALDLRVREGRFTQDQADATRAGAAKLIADLEAGRRWWDDSWADWRPQ